MVRQQEQPPPIPRSQARSSLNIVYEVGDIIAGEFKVERVIEGGLGRVYIANRREVGPVILKVPKEQDDPDVRDAFRTEAETWVRIGSHPNVVRAFRVEEIAGQLMVVAELVRPDETGRLSLRDYLRGPLPLNVIARWCADFCYGLALAVSRGLVAHRDVKPENLLVGADGILRITDFGLSRAVKGKLPGWQPGKIGFWETRDDTLAGTPLYMAPEQWCGAAQDVRTDIYAFGLVLFEMCYGRFPYLPSTIEGLAQQHLHAQPSFAAHPFRPLVERCLAKMPDQRYSHPNALLLDLMPICASHGVSLPPRPPSPSREADDLHAKAHALSALGKHDEALAAARLLVRVEPDFAGNWTVLARLLFEAGDEAGAIDALDRALTLDLTRSEAWNNMGVILKRQGKWEAAMAAFDRALHHDPGNTGAMLNSTEPLRQLGLFEEALRRLRRASELAPDKFRIWNNMGAVYLDLRQKTEALTAFHRARALAPRSFHEQIDEAMRVARELP